MEGLRFWCALHDEEDAAVVHGGAGVSGSSSWLRDVNGEVQRQWQWDELERWWQRDNGG